MNRNSVRNRPTPCGARLEHLRDVLRQLDVGEQLDRRAVQRRRARRSQALELLPLDVELRLAQLVLAQHDGVGIDDQHALHAVDDHQLVLADHVPRVVQADQRRDAEAACDDRGVRGDAADVGDEAAELVALEQDHVGGRQVVRHHDQVLLLGEGCGAGGVLGAQQRLQHALDDLLRRPPCARAGRDPRSPRTARRGVSICCTSAHSALQRRSRISSRGACDSVESSRIMRCTLTKAPNSAGAPGGMWACDARRAPPWHATDRRVEARDLARDRGPRRSRSAPTSSRAAGDEVGVPDGDARGDAGAVQDEVHARAAGAPPLTRLRRTCRR